MDLIFQIIIGVITYRISGGLGNEFVRKLLGKPQFVTNEKGEQEGWEIPNNIACIPWALHIALLFPLSWTTPLLFIIVHQTKKIGYLKQIGEYFGFPSGFNLAKKENRTWQNYSLLSARGTLICLTAYALLHSLYPQLLGGVLVGALMPICYLIGFTIPEIKGKISHSQYGECLIAAVVTGGILWFQ